MRETVVCDDGWQTILNTFFTTPSFRRVRSFSKKKKFLEERKIIIIRKIKKNQKICLSSYHHSGGQKNL